MPGSYFEVIGQLNGGAGLHIIQLKEIDPLFPLVKPPLDKPTSPTSNIDATLLKIKLSPPSPIDTKPTKSRMLYNSTTNRANSLSSKPSISKCEDNAVSETADEYPASLELNVPFKSPNNKFKIKSCDMSLYVQEQIIPIIISSVDKGGRNDDIAARIQIAAHKNFESTWHCVVGDHFGSAVSHSIGGFLDIAYDEKTVLLWKD
ncbi:hypothetical protein I4U23_015511 [Adineta vaga]|nr:hypothetical protein I4U23_015511 [Adineta vaga]